MATFSERFKVLFKEFQSKTDFPNGPTAFSRKIGVSKGKVAGWLEGKGTPDLETMKKLCKTFDISLLWLLGASDERVPTVAETDAARVNALRDLDLLVRFMRYSHGETFDTLLREYIQNQK